VVRVVAFVAHPKEYGEDLKKLHQAARNLHPRGELRVARVINPEVVKHFKDQMGSQWFTEQSLNSLVLLRSGADNKSRVKVFYSDISSQSIVYYEWINEQSLDHIMELSGYSYRIITMLRKPFFVAFLEDDMKGDVAESKSLMRILERLAPMYPKFEFTYTKNSFYKQKKSSLGISWDEEPSLTFNFGPNPDQSIPFPKDREMTEASIKEYMNKILDGSLAPESAKNLPKKPAKPKRTFEEACLTEGLDALMFVYDSSMKASDINKMSKPFTKAARRFEELGIKSVKLTAFDAKGIELPDGVGLREHLPKIFFFPAYHKQQPYTQFYDISTEAIMKQVEAQADIKFTLPENAHMTKEDWDALHRQQRASDL
jgi:hypothetical protein